MLDNVRLCEIWTDSPSKPESKMIAMVCIRKGESVEDALEREARMGIHEHITPATARLIARSCVCIHEVLED